MSGAPDQAKEGAAVSAERKGKDAGIKASATFQNEESAGLPGKETGTQKTRKTGHYNREERSASLRDSAQAESGPYTRPADLNHFFPVDPTLPAHLQDPNRVPAPPSSQAEIDRRNRQFDRTHGFVRRTRQSYPTRESPDWKILNGR